MGTLEKFDCNLYKSGEFKFVEIDKLVLDDVMVDLFNKANPIAGLRTSYKFQEVESNLVNLPAIHSPMIVYRYRKSFRILTGFFTLTHLKNLVVGNVIAETHKTPIYLLSKKPDKELRKRIIQYDLTNNLLSKCFVSDSNKISYFLKSWFKKDLNKRSIYQSSEWLELYPEIDTVEKLANYLSISNKGLTGNG